MHAVHAFESRVLDMARSPAPMLVVMVAIAMTDVMFALDSIPAIFGLTKEPFLGVSANAFALMGLRQLNFLVEGQQITWIPQIPIWAWLVFVVSTPAAPLPRRAEPDLARGARAPVGPGLA